MSQPRRRMIREFWCSRSFPGPPPIWRKPSSSTRITRRKSLPPSTRPSACHWNNARRAPAPGMTGCMSAMRPPGGTRFLRTFGERTGIRMRLVADIGGTNARFALAVPETGELTEVQVLPVSEFADFPAALGAYLGSGREISAAAIAAAGPRDGDAISLTNAPWQIVAEDVSKVLGGAKVRLLNDLEAVALAIPHLGAEEAEAIAHCPPPKQASPMIAV